MQLLTSAWNLEHAQWRILVFFVCELGLVLHHQHLWQKCFSEMMHLLFHDLGIPAPGILVLRLQGSPWLYGINSCQHTRETQSALTDTNWLSQLSRVYHFHSLYPSSCQQGKRVLLGDLLACWTHHFLSSRIKKLKGVGFLLCLVTICSEH